MMTYSVDAKTKIATLDGKEYYPKAMFDGKTGKTEMIALTEDECKETKKIRDTVPAQQLEYLRKVRNQKLAETDWMTFADSPTMSDEWKTYRQELRDITKTASSIDDVKWPTKPS